MLFSMQLFEKLDVDESRAADDRAGWGVARLREKLAVMVTRAGEAAGKRLRARASDLALYQTGFAQALEGGRVDAQLQRQRHLQRVAFGGALDGDHHHARV